jgi:hypothetical protein
MKISGKDLTNIRYIIIVLLTKVLVAILITGCKKSINVGREPTAKIPEVNLAATIFAEPITPPAMYITPTITRPIPTGLTGEEAVALGLMVIQTIELTEDDKAKIGEVAGKTPEETQKQFNTLYAAWEKTLYDPNLAAVSNPEVWRRLDEYKQLMGFCQEKGSSVWPLFFQKVVEADAQHTLYGIKAYLLNCMLWDLTKSDHQKMWDQIKANFNRYNEKGQYVVAAADSILKQAVQALMALY